MKKCYLLLCFVSLSLTARNWDTSYHNTSTAQYTFAKSQRSVLQLKGNENILDVGCGTGRTSFLYAKEVPHGSVHGIDVSTNMIEFAQDQYKNVTNLSFEVADVTHMNYTEAFDMAMSFFCLHWVDDKQCALTQIHKALRSKGKAYLFVPVISDVLRIEHSYIKEILKMYPEWKSFVAYPNIESDHVWIARAQQAGFRVERSEVISLERYFETKLAYKEYAYTLGITTLPEAEHKKFIDLVTDKVFHYLGIKDDEPFFPHANILMLKLIKKD